MLRFSVKEHCGLAVIAALCGALLFIVALSPPTLADTLYEQPYYKSEEYFQAYCQAVRYYNSRLSDQQVRSIAEAILHYSYYYGLDPRLVVALVACESSFRPKAVSSAGAIGLGQLMPGTARQEGVNPYDAQLNIHGVCRVLCGHLKRYGDHGEYMRTGYSKGLELALAAYNAGPGAVEKYGGVPPYPETIDYVGKVLSEYRRLLGFQ
ncbi:lytic transglycosylase domain-containing protein [bacterium]|nr:lytic transglycosylase domain-containing protein [bacterium]